MFVLLFTYVFGSAINLPGGGSYQQYLISGMFGMTVADPLSSLAATGRDLFGGPNPSAAVQAWPMKHPELAVLVWSAALLTVFAPRPSTSTAARSCTKAGEGAAFPGWGGCASSQSTWASRPSLIWARK